MIGIVAGLRLNLDILLYCLTAGQWRALLLIDLEKDYSVFFLGANNPILLKAGDIFQRFVTADAQA